MARFTNCSEQQSSCANAAMDVKGRPARLLVHRIPLSGTMLEPCGRAGAGRCSDPAVICRIMMVRSL